MDRPRKRRKTSTGGAATKASRKSGGNTRKRQRSGSTERPPTKKSKTAPLSDANRQAIAGALHRAIHLKPRVLLELASPAFLDLGVSIGTVSTAAATAVAALLKRERGEDPVTRLGVHVPVEPLSTGPGMSFIEVHAPPYGPSASP